MVSMLMDADQVRKLRELAGKAPRLKWSVDWNSLCIVLASDGSGAFIAKTTSPSAAAFIAAASPDVVAQLAAEWEAQREALLDILEGRTLRTDKEKAREALSALAVSSSAPTTRKRRRSDGRSD
jgi:hypothetical protein